MAGLAAWFSMAHFRPDLRDVLHASPRDGYCALLVVPAMMIWFYFLERQARFPANKA